MSTFLLAQRQSARFRTSRAAVRASPTVEFLFFVCFPQVRGSEVVFLYSFLVWVWYDIFLHLYFQWTKKKILHFSKHYPLSPGIFPCVPVLSFFLYSSQWFEPRLLPRFYVGFFSLWAFARLFFFSFEFRLLSIFSFFRLFLYVSVLLGVFYGFRPMIMETR